jgi:hypothetical protein
MESPEEIARRYAEMIVKKGQAMKKRWEKNETAMREAVRKGAETRKKRFEIGRKYLEEHPEILEEAKKKLGA